MFNHVKLAPMGQAHARVFVKVENQHLKLLRKSLSILSLFGKLFFSIIKKVELSQSFCIVQKMSLKEFNMIMISFSTVSFS